VIAGGEVLVLTHRLTRTRLFGTGQNLTRDAVVVRLEDRDGVVGWGETYLVSGAADAARTMIGSVTGRDPDAAAAELAASPDAHRWALGAVSTALDDLRARRRGIPVSALYGDRRRDRVPAYASSRGYVEGLTPEAAWTEEAAAVHDRGFRAMKLRIGRYDLGAEIEAIERLVASAPPMTWMADGNGAYDAEQSRRLGSALDGLGFRWLEEPLPTSDYAAYAPLADALAIPLAGGETLETTTAAEPLLRGGSFDLVQPDIAICGGIGPTLEIARLATAAGRWAVPHACHGAIALAATLQALAVLPEAPGQPAFAAPILEHDVGENPILTDLLVEPLAVVDGSMAIPDGPGLGIEVDEARLRRLVAA
jgi:D-galactarolactone cycloisomerase